MIDVSIIIVNYNTLHFVKPCVDSIVEQTKDIDYEIIVVDNGSTDGSCEVLRKDKRLVFLPIGKNVGFGRANNYGFRNAAKGEYVFFLNSDTILVNNAIKQMYDFARQYEGKVGALGCVLEDLEGHPIHSYGPFPKMSDDWMKLLIAPIQKGLHLYKAKPFVWPDTWMKVDYITGADLFVSKSVLETCGLFNPAFFMYYEETELELRFAKKGYDNILLAGPRIIHLEGGSAKNTQTSQFFRDNFRQQKSEYIYYKLTEPKWKYLLFRVFHPILRQTLWFNPNVSFADKLSIMKQLFVPVNITGYENID